MVTELSSHDGRDHVLKLESTQQESGIRIPSSVVDKKLTFDFKYEGSFKANWYDGVYVSLYRKNDSDFDGMGAAVMPPGVPS